ncbi:MAG: aminotransferase class III-fold pyridoxal phosphate-dependent enzyme, partial [Thermoplasmata archaeon]
MAEPHPASLPTLPTRESNDLLREPRADELLADALTAADAEVQTPPTPPPEDTRKDQAPEAPSAETKGVAVESKSATTEAKAAGAEVESLPIPIARLVPKLKKSAKLFEEGKKFIPNASSSLIRVASYDPCPPFITAGKGSRIWDEDGNEYLDFNLAYGCLINGHAPKEQVKAIQDRAELGLHFAAPTALEIELAKLFRKMVPNAERVAFCSNGSDATMNAIRIARAVTGKDAILKFEGHYHGQHDYALISAEAPPIVAGLDEYPRPL